MTHTTANPEIVSRLFAESEIHRLHAAYAHRLDGGDFNGVAELFKHGEMDVVGNVFSGYEGVLSCLESGLQVHSDGTPRTWHTVANVLVEIDPSGATASSSCYYTVHQQLDNFPLQPICAGKYLDQFEKFEDQWRFTRRAVTLRFAGDLQHHVKGTNGDVVEQAALER